MSLIIANRIHAFKLLTLALGLGSLQPCCASETHETTDISVLNNYEERGKRLLKEWNDNRSVYSPFKTTTDEENSKMAEEIEEDRKQLQTELDQLRSSFSPFKIIAKTAVIAGVGIGLFQYMELSIFSSIFFPVTSATFYFLNSLETLNTKTQELKLRSLLLNTEVSTLNLKTAACSMLTAFSVIPDSSKTSEQK